MMPPIVMACSETQSQAPKKRTVICEMEPAASAMTEMPFSQRRFACLASSSSVLEARKRLSAGPSALKLLIWANPAINCGDEVPHLVRDGLLVGSQALTGYDRDPKRQQGADDGPGGQRNALHEEQDHGREEHWDVSCQGLYLLEVGRLDRRDVVREGRFVDRGTSLIEGADALVEELCEGMHPVVRDSTPQECGCGLPEEEADRCLEDDCEGCKCG